MILFILNFLIASTSSIEIEILAYFKNGKNVCYGEQELVNCFKYFQKYFDGNDNIAEVCFQMYLPAKLKNSYQEFLKKGSFSLNKVIMHVIREFEKEPVLGMQNLRDQKDCFANMSKVFQHIFIRFLQLHTNIVKCDSQQKLFSALTTYLDSEEFYFFNFYWICFIMKFSEIEPSIINHVMFEKDAFMIIKIIQAASKNLLTQEQSLALIKYAKMTISSIVNSSLEKIDVYNNQKNKRHFFTNEIQLTLEEIDILKKLGFEDPNFSLNKVNFFSSYYYEKDSQSADFQKKMEEKKE